MSDSKNSIDGLQRLIVACDAALVAFRTADGGLLGQNPSISVIRGDFLSLLALLSASTTKIAISLKPSSPTYSASITPLKDLTTHVSNLALNVRLIKPEHGQTLLREFKTVADHVVTALKQLAQVFLNQANGKPSADDLYLTKTGEVHHTIDKARAATNGLSTFNHIAVRKVWDQQQGSLVDALDELKELSESQSNTNEPADEIDDGWDELGLEAPSKLSPDELERLRKVESIIKLSILFHKYVIKRLLSAPFDTLPIQSHINPLLDRLADDSSSFSAAVDDLASSVHAPQDAEEMTEHLQAFAGITETLSSRIDSILSLPSVENLLKGSGKDAPARKWFDTCFDQLNKATKQLSELLPDAQ